MIAALKTRNQVVIRGDGSIPDGCHPGKLFPKRVELLIFASSELQKNSKLNASVLARNYTDRLSLGAFCIEAEGE